MIRRLDNFLRTLINLVTLISLRTETEVTTDIWKATCKKIPVIDPKTIIKSKTFQ